MGPPLFLSMAWLSSPSAACLHTVPSAVHFCEDRLVSECLPPVDSAMTDPCPSLMVIPGDKVKVISKHATMYHIPKTGPEGINTEGEGGLVSSSWASRGARGVGHRVYM